MTHMDSFACRLLAHWDSFASKVKADQTNDVQIDGHHLDLATVVAVARHGGRVSINPSATAAIERSAELVTTSLDRGMVVYGVNTGFGGSADTRTSAVEAFQKALIRGLHYGLLAGKTLFDSSEPKSNELSEVLLRTARPLHDAAAATVMPESWVRASMLIRLNSLSASASGVRLHTVQTLAELITKDIVPLIPVRGSISASGDLSPLSYIGGVMQGKPTVAAYAGDRLKAGERKAVRADQAMATEGIAPVIIGPKEGLAIVNGTAISAGAASLALHEALNLAALSQVLTAMSVEALLGTDESFDPFIAKIRPHPGQTDAAHNILRFLDGSKLVFRNDGKEDLTLRQDRYSIRTASQWIGPILEDLTLAWQQLDIEFNSVTDNPLVNIEDEAILHGGNFQAKAVSSAMEKTRLSLQTIGRMLSTQCTEMINPATNRGLPPNLVVDDPSESFLWKGTDIMIAALTSELGFLANPVATHVQSAEMGNQALNSLALISARYTLQATDILSELAAAHIIALCQALDLRAMNIQFLSTFEPEFGASFDDHFSPLVPDLDRQKTLKSTCWGHFIKRLDQTMIMDSERRISTAIESLLPTILKAQPASLEMLHTIEAWSAVCSTQAFETFSMTRTLYRKSPDAEPVLGRASRRIYNFVRRRLNVPMYGEGEIATPAPEDRINKLHAGAYLGDMPPTVGSYLTTVYHAIKTGALYEPVMECLRETTQAQAAP